MRVTDEYVFFWQEYFSNWAYAQGGLKLKIGKEEHTVPTSEHLFMIFKAQYFKDDETVQKMLEAKTPKDVKALGRQVKGFDPEKWDAISSRYMTKAVTMRYEQDKKFAKMLTDKKYEGKTFVEASPYDKIWGIGMNEDDPDVEDKSKWQGQNKLGKCLTALRDKAVAGKLENSNESLFAGRSIFHEMW